MMFNAGLSFWSLYLLIIIVTLIGRSLHSFHTISFSYMKNFNTNQTFPKDRDACVDGGICIINVRISVSDKYNTAAYGCSSSQLVRNITWDNKEEQQFLNNLRQECNGQKRCTILESAQNNLQINCTQSLVQTDVMRIDYWCKPTTPDNLSVFDMSKDINTWLKDKALISAVTFILRTKTKLFNSRSCIITTNKRDALVHLLHIDWGQTCYKTDIAYKQFIEINNKRIFYCESRFNYTIRVSSKQINITVSSTSRFIWMEVQASKFQSVECQNHKPQTVDYISEAETSCPALTHTTTKRTTSTSKNLSTSDWATTLTTLISSVHNSPGKGTNRFFIISISSGVVALLTLVVVIIIAIALCRRRNKIDQSSKKDKDELPSSQHKDGQIYHEIFQSENVELYRESHIRSDPNNFTPIYLELEDSCYTKK
ncbi:hypothetical protein Bpfe_023177 [Biomphalaria pfeifferi]|uniref:Uncharacterized protein n=1 Tax=Biomphalaria pfeifferi TaxID=112525 RepID=A0AAD8B3R6_BIOPF|nr:hypothetical protein Bpfe_023177 [Biomphalaria pfeifferi]